MDGEWRKRLGTGALTLALCGSLAGLAHAETFTLRLVQTNDIDRMEEDAGRGGFAKLATVVKSERRDGPTLFIHSGDTISPSLLSGIDQGAHIIDILNHMGVDAMVPGNHEFDFGPDVFRQRLSEAKFPIVSANVVMPEGGGPANSAASRMIEVNGVRIGVYGLTTDETPDVSSPGDIVFTDPLETGLDAAEDLRTAGADIVIAVAHTPLDVDLELVRDHAADVVLSGHDEFLTTFFDGRTVLTESGSQADRVVITELVIERTEADGKVSVSWYPEFRVVDTLTVAPDPEIAALVGSYEQKLDEALGTAIGTSETPLDSRRAVVRGGEAAIGNLIADAIREAVEADVAMTNGGGIRADREYPAGAELTRRTILAELPFGNRTAKLQLTGAELRETLENGFADYPGIDGRNPQISGMTVTVDLGKPAGQRVLKVEVGGKPLDPAAKYTLATNDFMARGGNGYAVLARAKRLTRMQDERLLASDVIDYVVARKTVAPKLEGRIAME